MSKDINKEYPMNVKKEPTVSRRVFAKTNTKVIKSVAALTLKDENETEFSFIDKAVDNYIKKLKIEIPIN